MSAPSDDHNQSVVAYLPCPVKVPLEHALRRELGSDENPSWLLLEGNANKSRTDYVETWREPPAVFLSPGINEIFLDDAVRARVDGGDFVVPNLPDGAHPALPDARGHVLAVATNLTVLVVDSDRLDGRAAPTRWEDLLDPIWTGSVAMRGDGTSYCETTLLTWHSLFGMEGMRRLRPAVALGVHPAQMAKVAGSGRTDAPAIYVMPWMFASNIPKKDRIRIVWPEEGAIMSPLTLVARSNLDQDAQRVVDWLCSREAAEIVAGAKMPSLLWPSFYAQNPTLFLGWDALRSGSLGRTLAEIETFFAPP